MNNQRKNHFVITSGKIFESINISCGGKLVRLDNNAVSMPFDLGCIKDKCPKFKAFHVVSSKSNKKLSPEYGKYAWAYLEYADGTCGKPQLIDTYLTTETCMKKAAPDCVYMAAHCPDVLAQLLGQKSQRTK